MPNQQKEMFSPRSNQVFFEKIGRRAAQKRFERRLTQQELAKRSGLDRTQVALLENGKRHPTLVTLRPVAKALRLPLGELFRGL